jgi:hypothetical protein
LQKQDVKKLFQSRKARAADHPAGMAREKLCQYFDSTLDVQTGNPRVLEQIFSD